MTKFAITFRGNPVKLEYVGTRKCWSVAFEEPSTYTTPQAAEAAARAFNIPNYTIETVNTKETKQTKAPK